MEAPRTRRRRELGADGEFARLFTAAGDPELALADEEDRLAIRVRGRALHTVKDFFRRAPGTADGPQRGLCRVGADGKEIDQRPVGRPERSGGARFNARDLHRLERSDGTREHIE